MLLHRQNHTRFIEKKSKFLKNLLFKDISSFMGKVAQLSYCVGWLLTCAWKPISASDRRSSLCVCIYPQKSREIRMDWRKSLYGWRFGWWQSYHLRLSASRSNERKTSSRWNCAYLHTVFIPGFLIVNLKHKNYAKFLVPAITIESFEFYGSIVAHGRCDSMCCRLE